MGFTSHGPTRSKSTYRDGVCGSHSHLIPRMYSLPASTRADTSPGNAPERQRGRTAIPAAWVLVEEYRARTCLGAFLGRAATAGNNLAAAPARRRIDHQSEPRNGRAFCARKVDIVLRSRLLAQKGGQSEYVCLTSIPLACNTCCLAWTAWHTASSPIFLSPNCGQSTKAQGGRLPRSGWSRAARERSGRGLVSFWSYSAGLRQRVRVG